MGRTNAQRTPLIGTEALDKMRVPCRSPQGRVDCGVENRLDESGKQSNCVEGREASSFKRAAIVVSVQSRVFCGKTSLKGRQGDGGVATP